MGIPGYFKNLIKSNPKLLYWNAKEVTDYFFMDYNGIIHTSSQQYLKMMEGKLSNKNKSTIEKEIINYVVEKTIEVVTKIVKPNKLLYIAMDGVPPRAKMEQQRLRRYKTPIEMDYSKHLKKRYDMDTNTYFNNIVISPGTLFMERVSKELIKNIKKLKPKNADKDFEVILSDTSVVGEGEHKIIPYIKTNLKDKSNICIYGDDADLILLSMTLGDHHIKIMKTQNLPEEYGEYAYLSVTAVGDEFYKYINLNDFEKIRILYDYIFVMSLFGDDFIKKLPSLDIRQHQDKIMDKYKTILHSHKKHLVLMNKGKVNINNVFFKLLLIEIAKMEEESLRHKQRRLQHMCDRDYNPRDLEGYAKDMMIFTHSYFCQKNNPMYDTYHNVFSKVNYFQPKHIWKKEYYNYFFGLQGSNYNKGRTDISKMYLKSLKFTIEYYIVGIPSWTFYYPYRVAPFVSDLITNINKNENINKMNFHKNHPYTPLQQLMIILPPQMKSLVPKEYGKLMEKESLKKYYPKEYKIDALAGEVFWRSEPILPHMNDSEVLKEMDKLKSSLNKAELNRNTLKEPLTYK